MADDQMRSMTMSGDAMRATLHRWLEEVWHPDLPPGGEQARGDMGGRTHARLMLAGVD
jgi:hypothetical protein